MSYTAIPTAGRHSQLPEATGRFFANDPAVGEAVEIAASALWLGDSADYGDALWDVLRAFLTKTEMPKGEDDRRLRDLAGFGDTEDSP